jgi:hypothetical protein
VLDKVIEIGPVVPQTDVASVVPVSEIDVVIDEKGLRRTAQQRRKMPRHRGNEKNSGLRRNQVFFEMEQCTKGCLMDRRLAHRNYPIADVDGVDAKSRPAMAKPRAGNQLTEGCDSLWDALRDTPGSGCSSAAAAISAIARTGPAKSE